MKKHFITFIFISFNALSVGTQVQVGDPFWVDQGLSTIEGYVEGNVKEALKESPYQTCSKKDYEKYMSTFVGCNGDRESRDQFVQTYESVFINMAQEEALKKIDQRIEDLEYDFACAGNLYGKNILGGLARFFDEDKQFCLKEAKLMKKKGNVI